MSRSLLRRIAATAGIAAVAAVAAFIAPQAASADSDTGLYGGYTLDCSGPAPVLSFSGNLNGDNEGHNSGPSTVTDAVVFPDGSRHEYGPTPIVIPQDHSVSWTLDGGDGTYLVQQRVGNGLRWSDYQAIVLPDDCATAGDVIYTPAQPTFEQILCLQTGEPQTRVELPWINSDPEHGYFGEYVVNGQNYGGLWSTIVTGPVEVGFEFADGVRPPDGWEGLESFTPAACATLTSVTAVPVEKDGVRTVQVSGTSDLPYVLGEAFESLHIVVTASNGATVSVPVGEDGKFSVELTGDFADGTYEISAQLYMLAPITDLVTTSVTFVAATPSPSPTSTPTPSATPTPTATPTATPTTQPTSEPTASPAPSATVHVPTAPTSAPTRVLAETGADGAAAVGFGAAATLLLAIGGVALYRTRKQSDLS